MRFFLLTHTHTHTHILAGTNETGVVGYMTLVVDGVEWGEGWQRGGDAASIQQYTIKPQGRLMMFIFIYIYDALLSILSLYVFL